MLLLIFDTIHQVLLPFLDAFWADEYPEIKIEDEIDRAQDNSDNGQDPSDVKIGIILVALGIFEI